MGFMSCAHCHRPEIASGWPPTSFHASCPRSSRSASCYPMVSSLNPIILGLSLANSNGTIMAPSWHHHHAHPKVDFVGVSIVHAQVSGIHVRILPCWSTGDSRWGAYLLPIFLGHWPRHIQVLSHVMSCPCTNHPNRRKKQTESDIARPSQRDPADSEMDGFHSDKNTQWTRNGHGQVVAGPLSVVKVFTQIWTSQNSKSTPCYFSL